MEYRPNIKAIPDIDVKCSVYFFLNKNFCFPANDILNKECSVISHHEFSWVFDGDCLISIENQYYCSYRNRFFFVAVLHCHDYNYVHEAYSTITSISGRHVTSDVIEHFGNYDYNDSCIVPIHRPSNNKFLVIEIDSEEIDSCFVDCVKINDTFVPRQNKDLTLVFGSEIGRYAKNLSYLKSLGIDIDIHSALATAFEDIAYLKEFNDIVEDSVEICKKNLQTYKKISIPFKMTYDKKYYCVAKIAESANQILINPDSSTFILTFSTNQLEKIELSYYSYYASPFNNDPEPIEIDNVREFLYNHSILLSLYNRFNIYINNTRNWYGNIFYYVGDFIIEYWKAVRNFYSDKLNNIYSQMAQEGRIQIKWANEYSLYRICCTVFKEVIYQYRASWLGNQSYDIYIPSKKLAIEYQGKQHFEAVEHFGGKEALENSLRRDKKKKELSDEHGITLMYYPYTVEVSKTNLLKFLADIDIFPEGEFNRNISSCSNIDILAPVIKKDKDAKRTRKLSVNVIRQYSLDGQYICEYNSINDASNQTGISAGSINLNICNAHKSAGGYVWIRVERGAEIAEKITPVEVYSNAKAVRQYDLDNHLIQTHVSIAEAARQTQTDPRNIKKVIRGIQKTAGGFYWKLACDSNDDGYHTISDSAGCPIMVSQYDLNGCFIKTYASIAEAARAVNISTTGVRNALNGKQKTAGGFKWKRS